MARETMFHQQHHHQQQVFAPSEEGMELAYEETTIEENQHHYHYQQQQQQQQQQGQQQQQQEAGEMKSEKRRLNKWKILSGVLTMGLAVVCVAVASVVFLGKRLNSHASKSRTSLDPDQAKTSSPMNTSITGHLQPSGSPSVGDMPSTSSPHPTATTTAMTTPSTTSIVSWIPVGTTLLGQHSGDYFGWSVALSSDGFTLAVGAIGDAGAAAGSVRVLKFTQNAWTQLGQLIVGESGDEAGGSCALSNDGRTVAVLSGQLGNTAIVGTTGLVKIYRLSNNDQNWIQRGQALLGGQFGSKNTIAFSADGEIIVVGSPRTSVAQVYKYDASFESWGPLGNELVGGATSDRFGLSVDISNDGLTVIVGARANDDQGLSAGQARVYAYSSASSNNDSDDKMWTQLGQNLDGAAPGDQAGVAVSISGDGTVVCVGSNQFSNGGSGKVDCYAYHQDQPLPTWVPYGQTIPGESSGDEFGWSLSLSSDGNVLVVGATSHDGGGENAGNVRIFRYNQNSNNWEQSGASIQGKAAYDQTGFDVAISNDGNVVAVGSSTAVDNAGAVNVYQATF